MKKYNVTVNGVVYEVTVEEADSVSAPAVSTPVAPKTAAPKPATPKAAPAPASAGCTTVSAPMPGTILKVAVKAGDSVKAGSLVCILEAMKMENEIFAGVDGVVRSVNVNQGDSVVAGDSIVTIG